MKVLVTGGAGYVGSHAVALLHRRGHEVVVYDNLSRGHAEAVPSGCLVQGELADGDRIAGLLRERRIEAVMHFAAYALVPESVDDPALYYRNNVGGTLSLLEAMRAADVRRIVFSSTCATYGEPAVVPIREDCPQQPVNPYGFSKLVIEQALTDYAAAYGFGCAALRYFNACGASPEGNIGENHDPETHLIPLLLKTALGEREGFTIHGADYPTPDGTCVRDYIHVSDLAAAHVLALEALLGDGPSGAYNLGTGTGHTNREVLDHIGAVVGISVPLQEASRRPGDPPELVADASRFRRDFGWQPQHSDLETIIRTAWDWLACWRGI